MPFWEGVQRALRKVSQLRGVVPEGAQGAPGAKELGRPSGVPSAGSTRVGRSPGMPASCPVSRQFGPDPVSNWTDQWVLCRERP